MRAPRGPARAAAVIAALLLAGGCGGHVREVVVYTSVNQVFSAPVFLGRSATWRTRASRGRAEAANPLFGTTTVHFAAPFARWGDEPARAFLDALRGQRRPPTVAGRARRLGRESGESVTSSKVAEKAVTTPGR